MTESASNDDDDRSESPSKEVDYDAWISHRRQLRNIYAFVVKVENEGFDYYYKSYRHVAACHYCYTKAYREGRNLTDDARGLDCSDVDEGEWLMLEYVRRMNLGCGSNSCRHEFVDSDSSSSLVPIEGRESSDDDEVEIVESATVAGKRKLESLDVVANNHEKIKKVENKIF
jgi:hypothetical protein